MFIVRVGRRKRGDKKMAKLYVATIATQSTREVNVLSDTPEEAQAKSEAQLKEGETLQGVVDKGDVVA